MRFPRERDPGAMTAPSVMVSEARGTYLQLSYVALWSDVFDRARATVRARPRRPWLLTLVSIAPEVRTHLALALAPIRRAASSPPLVARADLARFAHRRSPPPVPIPLVRQGDATGGTMASSGEKVRLSFERLHYSVSVKGSALPKALLTDINGDVTSGHVLAILGPSGAGKTTLLNMLTLQQGGGNPSGYIKVNGEPLTTGLYDRACAYVEQTDTLWASLTAREHLECAITLFRPELDEAAATRKCSTSSQRRPRGVPGHQGGQRDHARPVQRQQAAPLRRARAREAPEDPVPGRAHERRRLGVGGAHDEFPQEDRRRGERRRRVHDPPTPASIFAGFDNAMVLSMGRVAYFGKAKKMGAYLAEIGSPPPRTPTPPSSSSTS